MFLDHCHNKLQLYQKNLIFIYNPISLDDIEVIIEKILNKKQLNIKITYFMGRMILVYLTKSFSPMSFDIQSKLVALRGNTG